MQGCNAAFRCAASIFLEDDVLVFGPRVKRVTYDDGQEGVELPLDEDGHSNRDLIQLVE